MAKLLPAGVHSMVHCVPRGIYRRFADAFRERVEPYAVDHGLDPPPVRPPPSRTTASAA